MRHQRGLAWFLTAVIGLLFVLSGLGIPARSQTGPEFANPHGDDAGAPASCSTCHQSHEAAGEPVIVKADEIALCYSCHDGGGANSNVKKEFTDAATADGSSFHPVPQDRLLCSDCHTPHQSSAFDIGQLRVKVGKDEYLHSPPESPIGNAFCFACHGPDSTFPTAIDLTAFQQTAHDTQVTAPTSGVTCAACHQPHVSTQKDLLLDGEVEEQLCFSCHSQADPRTSGGSNPFAAFNDAPNDYGTADSNGVRIYHHPIGATEQENGTRVVECSSCHNPHLVDREDAAGPPISSKVVDPNDTMKKWAVTWDQTSGRMTRGDISSWCILCHSDPSVVQPIAKSDVVPYDVWMVNDTSLDADGTAHDTFTAVDWYSSAPHGPVEANLACTACHDPHGSSNAYALREKVVVADPEIHGVTDASWENGVATLTLEEATIGPGVTVIVSGVISGTVPEGFNGTFVTTNPDAGPVITYDLPTDPGPFQGGGRVAPDRSSVVTGFGALETDVDRQSIRTFCVTCHVEVEPDHGQGRLCTACHSHGSGRL